MATSLNAQKFNKVSIILKSLITRYNKYGGIALSILCEEYKEQEQEELPFLALGYSSLKELLDDVEDVHVGRIDNYNDWYATTTTPTPPTPHYGRSRSHSSVLQEKTPSLQTVSSNPLAQKKVHVYLPDNVKKSESTTPPSKNSSTKSDTEVRKPADVPSLGSRHSSKKNSSRNRASSLSPSNRVKVPIADTEKKQTLPSSPPPPPPPSAVYKSGKPIPPLKVRIQKIIEYSNTLETSTTTTTTTTTVDNDPRKEVESLAEKLKLPKPIYKSGAALGLHENYSVLSLGPGYKFYSYPDGASSEEEAQVIVAKKAIIKLREVIAENDEKLPISDETIARRIIKIVKTHLNGIKEDSIPNDYKIEYNESLPDHWTEILVSLNNDNCIEIIDDSFVGRLIIEKKEESVRTSPHSLVLPTILKDRRWAVKVTGVEDTIQVWGRVIEPPYMELLESLEKDMKDHSCVMKPAEQVYPFHYYVVKSCRVKSCDAWHRVQVENIATFNCIKQAYIFFIDIGDRKWIDCELLFSMLPQFYGIAAQAIKMRISGVQDFASCKKVTEIAHEILHDKLLYIEVLDEAVDSSGIHHITGVFFGKSSDKDINLNNEIIKNIKNFCLKSPFVEKKNLKVLLSSVDDDGKIFVKSMSEALDIYQIILDIVVEEKLTDGITRELQVENLKIFKNEIYEGKLFLIKLNKNWIRVKILEILGRGSFKFLAIDAGYTFEINKPELINLAKLSTFLNKWPQQAIQVKLNNIGELNTEIIERLKKSMKKNEVFTCRVIKSGKIPSVVLFERTFGTIIN
ncbi:hypothetical protein HCN44_002093 [Aphidius gifuensis]|uniref:HTH OST-type domain-containing protein n=1 Tax=Aphidius gifuensis TaxID=684658 RepID=A0A834Y0Q2_APHGI|nr:hypothetical protein HCN44_002093 [Aphidius gifuensis]